MITEKIVIPLLKSLITAVLVALFATAWFIPSVPWKLFSIVLGGVCLASWLAVIVPTVNRFPKLKNQTNNNVSLKPQETRIEIVATDPSGQFTTGRWADLSISPMVMVTIARRIEAGSSFSHAGLAGPGRPLSRSEFEVLRDEFIARGLAYWINPAAHAQGCELTKAGRAVMKHFQGNNVVILKPLPQLQEKVTVPLPSSKAAHAHRRTRGERKAIIDN